MKNPIQHIKEFLYGTPLRRSSDGTYDGIKYIYKINIHTNQYHNLIIWLPLPPPSLFSEPSIKIQIIKNKTAMELRLEHHLTPPSRRGYAGHVGSDHQFQKLNLIFK